MAFYLPSGEMDIDVMTVDQLIALAMEGRLSRHRNSCFGINVAGVELARREDLTILSAIEQLLMRTSENSSLPDRSGLSYVLGAYFVNGVRNNCVDRCFDFVRECTDDIATLGIESLPSFFRLTDKGFAFGQAPSSTLFDRLSQLTLDPRSRVAEAARRVLSVMKGALDAETNG